jgi:hypothetical protein
MALAAMAAASALAEAPPNSQPNPFRTVETWFKLPAGRMWGSTIAVDIDRDGQSIWVAERCGANSCTGKMDPPILKFDQSGRLVKSFGGGMFVFPHGIAVDKGERRAVMIEGPSREAVELVETR